MKKYILLSALIFVVLYRLIFCYTIIRLPIDQENIVGVKYTYFTLLNPIRKAKLNNVVSQSLQNMSDSFAHKSFLYSNIKIDEQFNIIDVYKERNELYLFTHFVGKEAGSFTDYIFVYNNQDTLVDILY